LKKQKKGKFGEKEL